MELVSRTLPASKTEDRLLCPPQLSPPVSWASDIQMLIFPHKQALLVCHSLQGPGSHLDSSLPLTASGGPKGHQVLQILAPKALSSTPTSHAARHQVLPTVASPHPLRAPSPHSAASGGLPKSPFPHPAMVSRSVSERKDGGLHAVYEAPRTPLPLVIQIWPSLSSLLPTSIPLCRAQRKHSFLGDPTGLGLRAGAAAPAHPCPAREDTVSPGMSPQCPPPIMARPTPSPDAQPWQLDGHTVGQDGVGGGSSGRTGVRVAGGTGRGRVDTKVPEEAPHSHPQGPGQSWSQRRAPPPPGAHPYPTAWPGRLTLLQLHREQLQPLHPLLQLVLRGGGHGIHVLVAPVVVLVGVGAEHLRGGRWSGRMRGGRRGSLRPPPGVPVLPQASPSPQMTPARREGPSSAGVHGARGKGTSLAATPSFSPAAAAGHQHWLLWKERKASPGETVRLRKPTLQVRGRQTKRLGQEEMRGPRGPDKGRRGWQESGAEPEQTGSGGGESGEWRRSRGCQMGREGGAGVRRRVRGGRRRERDREAHRTRSADLNSELRLGSGTEAGGIAPPPGKKGSTALEVPLR